MSRLRLGTRGSALALAQSAWVKGQIEAHDPETHVDVCIIKTSGDRFVDAPTKEIGGKGIFTKEIEDALQRGEIDLAVHSLKDLPTQLPEGLVIAAVPRREDARDVLISRTKSQLAELDRGAKIGTGSLRRKSQLLKYRPDLALLPVRGNIDTRLKKLDSGQFDALILAAAGLRRIGREDRIDEFLSDQICVSAVAQGALGIEACDDKVIREQLSFIHDLPTFAEVSAERAFADCLGGGCHVPIGARARIFGDELSIVGIVATPDGEKLCREEVRGAAANPVELGQALAAKLLNQGVERLLARV